MGHENRPCCGHDHATKRGWHKDWRTWVIVGLMLAAMLAYVMSDNESLRFGGAPPQQPMPADAGP
jgi:hypothetical protein